MPPVPDTPLGGSRTSHVIVLEPLTSKGSVSLTPCASLPPLVCNMSKILQARVPEMEMKNEKELPLNSMRK